MQYSIFQSAELKNGRMELVMYLGVKSAVINNVFPTKNQYDDVECLWLYY